MKTSIAVLIFAHTLVGCAAMESQKAKDAQNEARARYVEAEKLRHFTCLTTKECERAFMAAKAFVTERSNMRVQVSDSSMISCYRPVKKNMISLSAIRKPVEKEVEQISLTAECNGYEFNNFGYCDNKVSAIYEDFQPYIESRTK